MGEASESKRDQAVKELRKILATIPYWGDRSATFVDLILDAAKEEIRAELAEQDEERRWQEIRRSMALGYVSPAFHEEYRALKAKREAAGKSTD